MMQLFIHVTTSMVGVQCSGTDELSHPLLSGEPDYFGRNEISSGGDLSHYSSASLY